MRSLLTFLLAVGIYWFVKSLSREQLLLLLGVCFGLLAGVPLCVALTNDGRRRRERITEVWIDGNWEKVR